MSHPTLLTSIWNDVYFRDSQQKVMTTLNMNREIESLYFQENCSVLLKVCSKLKGIHGFEILF